MRILVLHGYSGNALWQQKKDQKLETLLAPLRVELHHVDAPIQLPPFSVTDPLQRRLSWWSLKREDSWRRMGSDDRIDDEWWVDLGEGLLGLVGYGCFGSQAVDLWIGEGLKVGFLAGWVFWRWLQLAR
eukprot:Skav215882  [mRNA]  locus=scaffold956:24661:25756:- [translate_table: standard]